MRELGPDNSLYTRVGTQWVKVGDFSYLWPTSICYAITYEHSEQWVEVGDCSCLCNLWPISIYCAITCEQSEQWVLLHPPCLNPHNIVSISCSQVVVPYL